MDLEAALVTDDSKGLTAKVAVSETFLAHNKFCW